MMKRTSLYLGLVLILSFCISCTSNPPKINQFYSNILRVYNPDTQVEVEKLSLFVHIDDPNDIEFLYIIMDEEELYWTITADNWFSIERDGEKWLGTNSVVMADGSDFPLGNYRIQIASFSGDKDENVFSLRSQASSDIIFPEIVKEEDVITTNPSEGLYQLWFYSNSGDFILSKTISQEEPMSVNSLVPDGFSSDRVDMYLFTETGNENLLVGPYSLSEF